VCVCACVRACVRVCVCVCVCEFNYIFPVIDIGFVITFLHILMRPILFLKYLPLWKNNIQVDIWNVACEDVNLI
jgi:hypothetical protein